MLLSARQARQGLSGCWFLFRGCSVQPLLRRGHVCSGVHRAHVLADISAAKGDDVG
jgi:hypothetical protein